jgi:hypothetical protein
MNLRLFRWALLAYACFDLFFGGICGGFLPLTPLAAAQFTTVSGTVTDPNGLPYANGTIAATLVSSGSPTLGGLPYTPPTQPTGLNAAGSFTMLLADVTALSPGGSTWSFTVSCAAGCVPAAGGKGPITFTVTGITISGTSQSITATLSAAAPALSNITGGGGGPTINPTNNVIPTRSNATTFIDTPLIFSNGTSTAARGMSFADPTISQGGTPGSTFYIYCVVATDVFTNTRSTCFDTALGNATLTGVNFNTISVSAYSSVSPYIQPVGACNVYRTFSGGTPSSLGKIGTIAACASGGSLNDTGLVGDATGVPVDTSGVLASTGPAQLGQSYIYSDEVSLYVLGGIPVGASPTSIVTPGYTHNVIIAGTGAAAYANSGITAVGWDGTGNAHACTAIGYATNCGGDSSFAAGIGASVAGGGSSIAIGPNSVSSAGGAVAVGPGATGSAGNTVAIGKTATAGFTNSVVLGFNAAATATNQFIAGGPNVTDFYPGSVSGSAGTANIHSLTSMVSGNWSCFSVTPVTVSANVTTDQNLMACSLPAGLLSRIGETLRIHTKSVYTTPAASVATLTFKAKLCDVSGCGSGNVATLVTITSTANAGTITNNPVLFDVESSTQNSGFLRAEASGDLIIDLAATTTAAATVFNDTNTATIAGSPSDVNTNGATFLQITVAFSVASASNSVTERQLIVDTVN